MTVIESEGSSYVYIRGAVSGEGQVTPASSECPQLWELVKVQSTRRVSVPEHITSSTRMVPVP